MIYLYHRRLDKEQTLMTNNSYLFRFPTSEDKKNFKLVATNLNKTMNELLGELVTRYLREKKEAGN